MAQTITRKKNGKNFSYFDSDGRKIANKKEMERINKLAIPPAWKDVEIAPSPRAKIQATGIDDAGRKQYIYNPAFRAKQEAAKFDRIMEFGRKLPKLRERLAKDMRRQELDKAKVTACAVNLMDEAYFRVGNQQYATENETYGLTTLRSKHLQIEGDTIIFDFTGKSHQQQHKEVQSRLLANILKQLDETPGYELFRYYDEVGNLRNLTSSDINEYIKETMGADFSAKDFRTWGGTLLACIELAEIERPPDKNARQKAVSQCVKSVAARLGNTPAVTRGSYIDPRVINFFNESDKPEELYKAIKTAEKSQYIPAAEHCALKILSQKAA